MVVVRFAIPLASPTPCRRTPGGWEVGDPSSAAVSIHPVLGFRV